MIRIEVMNSEQNGRSIIKFEECECEEDDIAAQVLRLLPLINGDMVSEIRLQFWSSDWTDDDLESLASLGIAQRITELNLTLNKRLTDRAMGNVAKLVGLRCFEDYSWTKESQITGSGFEQLMELPQLKKLGLDIDALDLSKITAISRLKHLESLVLLGNPNDRNLDVLSRLRPHQPINIDINDPDEAEYSVESLMKLADVPNLRRLYIRVIPEDMSPSVGKKLVSESHDLMFVRLGLEEFEGIVTVPEIQPYNDDFRNNHVWRQN